MSKKKAKIGRARRGSRKPQGDGRQYVNFKLPVDEMLRPFENVPADSPLWEDAIVWQDIPAPYVDGLPRMSYAHLAAMAGKLPPGFDRWDLQSSEGESVASMAAREGRLPPDFDRWEVKDASGASVAHVAAAAGHLPEGFSRWDLWAETSNGRTSVAHAAAFEGHVPADLPEEAWMLRDGQGATVYHVAAQTGCLPEGFDRWDVTTDNGWTVAHIAAKCGHLPADVPDAVLRLCPARQPFLESTVAAIASGRYPSIWREVPPNASGVARRAKAVLAALEKEGMASSGETRQAARKRTGASGRRREDTSRPYKLKIPVEETVRSLEGIPCDSPKWAEPVHWIGLPPGMTQESIPSAPNAYLAAVAGTLPAGFKRWDILDAEGYPVAFEALRHGKLPTWFDQWSLPDPEGTPIAVYAAELGLLPPNFDQWHLKDVDGFTVAHAAAYYDKLPAELPEDAWMLRENGGYTVYHLAAKHGNLPKGFDGWDISSDDGFTVAHMAALYGHLPLEVPESIFRMENKKIHGLEKTVAGFAARKIFKDGKTNHPDVIAKAKAILLDMCKEIVARKAPELLDKPLDIAEDIVIDGLDEETRRCYASIPAKSQLWAQYASKEHPRLTNAHVAAALGVLPEGFDQWDLTDDNGWTIVHTVTRVDPRRTPYDHWHVVDDDGGHSVGMLARSIALLPPGVPIHESWDIQDGIRKGDAKNTRKSKHGNAKSRIGKRSH